MPNIFANHLINAQLSEKLGAGHYFATAWQLIEHYLCGEVLRICLQQVAATSLVFQGLGFLAAAIAAPSCLAAEGTCELRNVAEVHCYAWQNAKNQRCCSGENERQLQ